MKKICLLLLISFPLFTIAQNKLSGSKKLSKFRYGLTFSTDYSYRRLTVKPENEAVAYIIPVRNKNESANIGYTFGLNIDYSINKLVSLETGLNYSVKGYKTNSQVLVFESQLGTTSFSEAIGFTNYHYLEIPIKAGFSFGKNKIQFTTGVGVVAGFFLKNTTKFDVKSANGNTTSYSDNNGIQYRKFNISPVLNIGIKYNINENSYLKIEPTFKYGLIAIVDAPIKENLWSVGLNVSYYIAL
jgi:hypothetical protein